MILSDQELRRIIRESIEEVRAYHGSGFDFRKFNHKKYLGSGCGSQVFGWGTYVTDDVAIGESYATNAKRREETDNPYPVYDGKNIEGSEFFKKYFYKEASLLGYGNGIKYGGTACSDFYSYLCTNDWDLEKAERYYISLYGNLRKRIDYLKQYDDTKDSSEIKSLQRLFVNIEIIYNVLTKYFNNIELWRKPYEGDESNGYLYEVEIPDDNGNNYIDWYGIFPSEFMLRVLDGLHSLKPSMLKKIAERNYPFYSGIYRYLFSEKFNKIAELISQEDDYHTFFNDGISDQGYSNAGRKIYRYLQKLFNSDKGASLFLMNCCNFDGIKYETGTRMKKPDGASDDGHNYVIFDANKVKIIDKKIK